MTELNTITKISLVVYGLICLLNAIMLIFLLDDFITPMTGWTNPLSPRQWGGALLGITIFAFFAVIRNKEWEEIKFGFEFMYYLVIMNIIVEGGIGLLMGPTATPAAISQIVMDVILMSIVVVLGVYSYLKQRT
jgi:hypothetical protein